MKSYSRITRLIALSLVTAMLTPQLALATVNPKGNYDAGFNQGVPERVQRIFIYERDKYPRNEVTARRVRSGQIENIELRFHDEAQVTNSTALYFEAIYNKPDKPAKGFKSPTIRDYYKEAISGDGKLSMSVSNVYSYALGGQEYEILQADGVTKETRKGLSYDDYGATNLRLNLNVQDMWDVILFGDLRDGEASLMRRRTGYKGLVAREAGTLLLTLGGAYAVYATVQRMAESKRATKVLPGFKGFFKGFKNLPNNFFVGASNLAREWREIHRGKGGGAVFGKVIWITTYFAMGTTVWRLLNSAADEIIYGPEQAEMEFLHKTISQAYKQVTTGDPFDATYANMELAESKYKEFEKGTLEPIENPTPEMAVNGSTEDDNELPTVEVTVRDVQPVAHNMSFAVGAFKRYFTEYFEAYDISQSSRLVEKKAKLKKKRQEDAAREAQQQAEPTPDPTLEPTPEPTDDEFEAAPVTP